jgi:hypothetical protein
MEPLAGDDPVQVAGYQLRARLGAGGMGRVYLAFTPGGRPVALKIVRPGLGDDADFRHRFRQEVAAARRVHGLYTAQVLDADPDASPPWLVTAYVAGPSLQQAVGEHGHLGSCGKGQACAARYGPPAGPAGSRRAAGGKKPPTTHPRAPTCSWPMHRVTGGGWPGHRAPSAAGPPVAGCTVSRVAGRRSAPG